MTTSPSLDRRLLGLGLLAVPLAACADTMAQPSPATGLVAPRPVAADVNNLRLAAASGGTFLMQSAQLGAQKATRPDLRRWAPFEVSEQQGLMRAMELVGANPAQLVPTPADKAAMLRDLEAANGRAFDGLFVRSQVMGHQEALGVFEAMAGGASSPAGDRAIALLAADRIREHLADLAAMGGMRA